MCSIIIYGKGKTGQNLAKLVQTQGYKYAFYDDTDGFDRECSLNSETTVIVSPGISPQAQGYLLAKQNQANLICEFDYCFDLCKGQIISITGTNGKTTTCEMLNHALKLRNKTSWLLGNGGIPFSSHVLDIGPNDYVVLESSSFQLLTCKKFAPTISVITNLAPDHLDYHNSFENYCDAKKNNFINQSEESIAIFNADDVNVLELSKKCHCKRLYYSVSDTTAHCYYQNGTAVVNLDDKIVKISSNYFRNLLPHNLSNCLCVLLVCAVLGMDASKVIESLTSYKFLPHRLQKVANFNGVEFIDDSKATNIHATNSAIRCFNQPISLILGGSDKGYDFDDIFCCLPTNVKYVCASGQTANKIKLCADKYGVEVAILSDIKDAVWWCYQKLKHSGGVVLMSNACASFDRFNSYKERGMYFQKAVEELISEQKV